MYRRFTAIVALGVLLVSCSACAPEPAPSPTSVSAAPTPRPSTPTPSITATPGGFADCDDLATDEFRTAMEESGWVGWNTLEEEPSFSPFDALPEGAPAGALSCRWGEGSDVATDNVFDFAWAPIDPAQAERAQSFLSANGYARIDGAEGIYLALPVDPASGQADEDGLGPSFFFTGAEVRWAQNRDLLAYIRSTPN